MNEENFRLYVGSEITHYRTFEEAKDAAKSFMPGRSELRIEIMMDIDLDEADFWAYNYETNQWEPS